MKTDKKTKKGKEIYKEMSDLTSEEFLTLNIETLMLEVQLKCLENKQLETISSDPALKAMNIYKSLGSSLVKSSNISKSSANIEE